MFDPQAKQVVFVPSGRDATFTDLPIICPPIMNSGRAGPIRITILERMPPEPAAISFKKAANPQTGLMPDYANFDGTPATSDEHKDFRFDAWRTLSNVAVDYAWFGADPWQVEQSNRVLDFLASQGMDSYPNHILVGQGNRFPVIIPPAWLPWRLWRPWLPARKLASPSSRLCGMPISPPVNGAIMMACFICWRSCMSAAIPFQMAMFKISTFLSLVIYYTIGLAEWYDNLSINEEKEAERKR